MTAAAAKTPPILRWGGEVYAMDLSFAVDAAYANLVDRPRAHVVQASVFDLPFRTDSPPAR